MSDKQFHSYILNGNTYKPNDTPKGQTFAEYYRSKHIDTIYISECIDQSVVVRTFKKEDTGLSKDIKVYKFTKPSPKLNANYPAYYSKGYGWQPSSLGHFPTLFQEGNDYYGYGARTQTINRFISDSAVHEIPGKPYNDNEILIPKFKVIGWFYDSNHNIQLMFEEVPQTIKMLTSIEYGVVGEKPKLVPYQPTSRNIKGIAHYTSYNYTSNATTESAWVGTYNFNSIDDLENTFNVKVNLPDYFTEPSNSKKVSIHGDPYYKKDYWDDNVVYLDFEIGDYTTNTTTINYKDTPFKIYVGKPITQDFANNFSLKRVRSNEYHTETTLLEANLNVDNITPKKFGNEEPITINYISNDGKSYSYPTGKMPIGLAVGETKFNAIVLKKVYKIGETISYKDIKTPLLNAKFIYSDDTFTSELSSFLTISDISVSSDLADGTVISSETPDFNVTITYNTTDFGTLTQNYSCTVEGVSPEYAVRGEIVPNIVHLKANEPIKFPSNAKINLYNQDDEIIETITDPFLGETKVSTPPQGYGARPSKDLYVNANIPRPFRVKNRFDIDWNITVDYYSGIRVNTTQLPQTIFVSDDTPFNDKYILDRIACVSIQRLNSVNFDMISEAGINQEVRLVHDPIEIASGSKIYTIKVLYTDPYGDNHEASFNRTFRKVEPVSIIVSGSATGNTDVYYNNNSDKFKIPTGLTFQYKMSDGTTNPLVASNLSYYRSQTSLSPLDSQSIIKQADGTRIYVRDKTYNVEGSYLIRFVNDTVVSVAFDSETPKVDLILGNRFNKIKPNLVINAIYESGVISKLDTSDYEIIGNDLIMSATDLNITYLGKEYNLGQSQINFVNPTIKETILDTKDFQKTYSNLTDKIDCSNITIKLLYKDSEYTETLTYSSEPISGSTYKNFNVSSNIPLNKTGDFAFDGSTNIDIDFESQSQLTAVLTFTYNDKFSGSKTSTLDIQILEILEIVGISPKNIKNTYYVGEKFLNENDPTVITVFFKDSQGTVKKIDTKLNGGFTGINIVPSPGTKLTTATNSLTISISSATNYQVVAQYTIRVIPKIGANDTTIHNIVALFQPSYVLPNGDTITDKYLLVDEYYTNADNIPILTTKINADGERELADVLSINDIKVYGYLNDIDNELFNAKVILFDDYMPPVDGVNNIEVTYPCFIPGNADKINKAHLGILFGSNNAKNRLFVSGNKEFANIDWYSTSDLSYFEDTSYCQYGETDSAIVGYSIVSDNKLLVLKDYSEKDTTIWFRVPQLVKALVGNGLALGVDNEPLYEEAFALVKGNNTVAGVSPKSIINFNGDTLFYSNEKSICGLDLEGIIGDNQRYANSRSYYIDHELERISDKNTWLWSNNKYLAVVVKDRVFLTHYQTIADKQYEWWQVDINDCQAIIELNGHLYYGNSKGQFYKQTDGFVDIKTIFVKEGGALLVSQNEDDNRVIVNKEIIEQLKDNETYKFKCIAKSTQPSSYMYYKIAKISNSKINDFDFYIDKTTNSLILYCYRNGATNSERLNEVLNLLDENKVIYLNHYENAKNEGIATSDNDNPISKYYVPYYLKRYESDDLLASNNYYKLYDTENHEIDISTLLRANICYRLDGEFEIRNIDRERSCFNLFYNEQLVDLIQYADQPISRTFKAEIKHFDNIKAFYITKPYVLGNLNYFKTIWQWTLTNDTNIPSELSLTYASNKIPFESMKTLSKISVDKLSISLEDMSFVKIDFDKTVVPRTYTNERLLSNLKFICFGFVNYNNTNSVISSMSIVYSTPTQSYSGD